MCECASKCRALKQTLTIFVCCCCCCQTNACFVLKREKRKRSKRLAEFFYQMSLAHGRRQVRRERKRKSEAIWRQLHTHISSSSWLQWLFYCTGRNSNLNSSTHSLFHCPVCRSLTHWIAICAGKKLASSDKSRQISRWQQEQKESKSAIRFIIVRVICLREWCKQ